MRYFVGFDPEYTNAFIPGKLYVIHWDNSYQVWCEQQHAHWLRIALEVVKRSVAVEFSE